MNTKTETESNQLQSAASDEVAISMSKVNKWFGNFHVLKDIDLSIYKGERIVICGPSGSGKSTLIRCINRLEEHQDGDISVNGVTLDSNLKNIHAIRSDVGMVFQSFNLINFKNALENVALPLYYQGLKRKERQEKAMFHLEKVGLADWAKHLPNELSGGQKQRVAIARALAAEPKLLLADEPTGALDSATSHEIMQFLQQLNDEGKTILIVTHEEDISLMCKRIVRLKDGVILEDKKIKQNRLI